MADVMTLIKNAEAAVRQKYCHQDPDPEPATNALVWLKLSQQGLTRQQWQQLVTMAPTPFPVSALELPHCNKAPVAMVLRAEGPAEGMLRLLAEPSHPAVDLQLGAGTLEPAVLETFERYVAKKVAAVGDGPPFLRPDLLLWDGAAYVCDECQWGNDEIRLVEGHGYTSRDLRSRVWVQQLGTGDFFIPL